MIKFNENIHFIEDNDITIFVLIKRSITAFQNNLKEMDRRAKKNTAKIDLFI